MKRYQITLDGKTFDVRLLSDPRQEQVQVEVNGTPLTVEVKEVSLAPEGNHPEQAAVTPPPAAAQAQAAPARLVVAPLPGTIKSIKVRPGQQVTPGDELLVIDAMKMDNLIRASRPGVIDTIHVAEGHQVSHGEHLLEYAE